MSVQQQRFTRVASLPEVVEGQPKAVSVKGHSVALFNVGGRIYATDNQCPHMGYPLTRGAIRGGVLTCDWHGWSFDLEGGGCFVGGCDDLATFPVDVRDGEIWLDLNKAESSRRDEPPAAAAGRTADRRQLDALQGDRAPARRRPS